MFKVFKKVFQLSQTKFKFGVGGGDTTQFFMNQEKTKLIKDTLSKNLNLLSEILEKEIGENFKIDINSPSTNEGYSTFKIDVFEVDENGKSVDKFEKFFTLKAHEYGLKSSFLHKTFIVNNTPYKIIGLNPSNTKKKILTKSCGKTYIFTPQQVLKYLK